MAGSDETQIRELIARWTAAVEAEDVESYLADHSPDIVMFDVPPPLQSHGLDEYRKTWDLFFTYHKPLQPFDIEELTIVAGDNVAFAFAIMRCGTGASSAPRDAGGLLFRLTIGLRQVDGDWRIAHEHHSVPAED